MAEIKWFGHNCFRIRAKEATVIIDPVDRVTGIRMNVRGAPSGCRGRDCAHGH